MMEGSLPERLETARLVLRAPRASDPARLFEAYTQDPEASRYMIRRPHTALYQTEAYVSECIDQWHDGSRRAYVLTYRGAEDDPIGMLDMRFSPPRAEFGYVLARAHWGQGLMPEAVRVLVEAALALPDIFRVQATCDVDNIPSARTLEKSGFTREARLERYCVHPNLEPEPRASYLYARWR